MTMSDLGALACGILFFAWCACVLRRAWRSIEVEFGIRPPDDASRGWFLGIWP